MNDYEIARFSEEIFSKNCISKVELAEFKAAVGAFERISEVKQDLISKGEKITKEKINLIREKIRCSNDLIIKIESLATDPNSENKKKILKCKLNDLITSSEKQLDEFKAILIQNSQNYNLLTME